MGNRTVWTSASGSPFATARALAVVVFLIVSMLTLLLPGSLVDPAKSGGGSAELQTATTPSVSISDGQTVNVTSPVPSVLTDTLSYGSGTGGTRSYWINLTASVALPNVTVSLSTFPVLQWGLPLQLPGGPDALPPLGLWSWTILRNGVNDTPQWSVTSWDQKLSRATAWTNQSYEVLGVTTPQISVTVDPDGTDGTTTPGTGFVVNTPGVRGEIPTNDTGFDGLVTALQPSVIRFSTLMTGVSGSWNTATNQPKYNFTFFDQLVNLSHLEHAQILLSLPAGSWGDGNLLPAGMPLNQSLLVNVPGCAGYFPNDQAWQEWLGGLVNHTVATGANITYWSIGNEVPTYNLTEVAGYTHVYNLAEEVVHAQLPGAKVGSDVMTNLTFESYFATHAQDVGFLSFHYYAAVGLCLQNGAYCPPEGSPNGSPDPSLFSHTAYAFLGNTYAPKAAQSLWHNLSGNWLPILNAESNLNTVGGNPQTVTIGTDPRTQTLFGASWLISTLIDSADQNVSDLVYFALSSGFGVPNTTTAPYGGWGFGLSREGTNSADVRFAPYYALEMWSAAIPPGESGVATSSSSSTVVYSYAAQDGTNLSVVLVNRVNLPVTVTVNLTSGNDTLGAVTTLDQRSYSEKYVPSEDTTTLSGTGVNTTHPENGSPIEIDGYGLAVATYVPPAVNGSGGGGNTTGGGGGNTTGGGGGNTTGGGGGNTTGGGGGNTTGGGGGNTTGGGGGNATGGDGGNTTGGGGGNTTGTGGGNSTGGGGNSTGSGNSTAGGSGGGGNVSGTTGPSGGPGLAVVDPATLLQQISIIGTILALGAVTGSWASVVRARNHRATFRTARR